MHLYSCGVHLKGSLINTVSLENVTAAEIRILDHIHQGDNPAVYNITSEREVARSDADERRRLADKYGEFNGMTGAQIVAQVLGVPGVPLPQKLEDDDARIVADNGIKRARVANFASEQAKRKPDPILGDDDDEPTAPVVRAPKPPVAPAAAAAPFPSPDGETTSAETPVRRHRAPQTTAA